MSTFSIYPIQKVLPLRGGQYFDFLRAACASARKRIWATIFIVNPLVHNDRLLAIRSLLKTLAYAQWRNVDVRLLLGSSEARDIRVANDTAAGYLQSLGIPVRRFGGAQRKRLHSKYVAIDDDLIVVGSHNWTPFAVSTHNEDSIAVYARDTNHVLCDEFLSNWQNGGSDR